MCTREDPPELTRFLAYTKVNTTSDASQIGVRVPTTAGQEVLAALLAEELTGLGLAAVHTDEKGVVYAELPATPGFEAKKTVGFAPHLDTAPDYNTDTHAHIIRNYAGGSITLQHGGVTIPEAQLQAHLHDDIVVTDGTSLLGGDDKAAIAAVVQAVHEVKQADKPHGAVALAFLPDEEIGLLGAKSVDLTRFKPDFGYCLDACAVGEYAVKTWYAAKAFLTIKGKPAHPMNSKGRCINANHVLTDYVLSRLPKEERLEVTEGEEGAMIMSNITGTAQSVDAHITLRYFTTEAMEERKTLLRDAVAEINRVHGDIATLSLEDTYSNPKALLDEHPHVHSIMLQSMERLGIVPKPFCMRGGYDGCALADRGLPFANFFTGSNNFHCNTEFLPVASLTAAKDMVKDLIYATAEL